GTSGRNTGISFAAEMLLSRNTCVTYSSVVTSALPSVTPTGAERASLFWITRTTSPERTAAYPCTSRIDRNSWYSSLDDTGLEDITFTRPFTEGSTTIVVPVASATNLISSWMSVSFRLTVKSCASRGTPTGSSAHSSA